MERVHVKEMESLDKNVMWDPVKFLNGRNLVGSKWVFKKKLNVVGQFDKYKAWLVMKGHSQVEGVNIGEIFSLVAKLTSIRLLFSLAMEFYMEKQQMDVNTIFLHVNLEEQIYMKQPEGSI